MTRSLELHRPREQSRPLTPEPPRLRASGPPRLRALSAPANGFTILAATVPENQGAVRPGDAKRDISPLIDRPFSMPGRPRIPDRRALCGILFVLHTGIQWEYLPQELGFGSGMTCWRRLAAWNEAVVCDEMHLVPLKLRAAKQLDWSRAVIDSSTCRPLEEAQADGLPGQAR